MRSGIGGLSVPQFRTLIYVRRNPGTGLSGIADHVGTSLPASSELVNRLVKQGLLIRETDPRERRRICLTLSPTGSAMLGRAQGQTTEWLRGLLSGMTPDQLGRLLSGLRDLRSLLPGAPGGWVPNAEEEQTPESGRRRRARAAPLEDVEGALADSTRR